MIHNASNAVAIPGSVPDHVLYEPGVPPQRFGETPGPHNANQDVLAAWDSEAKRLGVTWPQGSLDELKIVVEALRQVAPGIPENPVTIVNDRERRAAFAILGWARSGDDSWLEIHWDPNFGPATLSRSPGTHGWVEVWSPLPGVDRREQLVKEMRMAVSTSSGHRSYATWQTPHPAQHQPAPSVLRLAR